MTWKITPLDQANWTSRMSADIRAVVNTREKGPDQHSVAGTIVAGTIVASTICGAPHNETTTTKEW